MTTVRPLRPQPGAGALGGALVHVDVTGSTNDHARVLATGGAPTGTVVVAEEQTAGRGRQGRSWSAPRGRGLTLSLVWKPAAGLELLPLAAAVAVCEACEQVAPVRCRIKWPNDVWIGERKLAGILIESRPQEQWAVIGIGVNVSIEPAEFPDDLRWPATSIGHGVRVETVRKVLCAVLTSWTAATPEEILAAFRGRDALLGRGLSWEGGEPPAGSGTGAGVDERGHLVVELEAGGSVALGAGEVSLRVAAE